MRWLLSFVCVVLLASQARAESGAPPCEPGRWLPDSTHVPANLPAFVLRGGTYLFRERAVAFYQRVGTEDQPRAFTFERASDLGEDWVLTPTAPLEEGGAYVVVDQTCDFTAQATYFVDPPLAPPTTLGTTQVSELRSVRRFPTSSLQYFVVVSLTPSTELQRAEALYEVSTVVDGEAVSDGDWDSVPAAVEGRYVYVDCDSPGGHIEPGTRAFDHRARLFGQPPSLSTDAVVADLRCDEAVRWNELANRPATPEEIVAMDTIRDAGVWFDADVELDAGVDFDASYDDASSPMTPPAGGCSCRAASSGGRGAAALVGVGVMLLLRRRARVGIGRG